MSRKLIFLGILSLILAPGAALSVGLGDIRLNSYLNQPMDAQIGLSVNSRAELDELKVELASAEAFARYGLQRPAYFDDLRFQLRSTGPSSAVIEVSSSRPIVEPFVTFLVEASWSGGRILREYTVLLDPPVFLPTPEAAPAAAPAPAPVVETPRPAPVAEPAPESVTRPAPSAAPVAAPAPLRSETVDEYGPVQRNQTLWGIAQRVRPEPSLTTNQIMVALFEANPGAFDGNINRLRAGAVLRVPSREQMAAVSTAAANAEVRRQTETWRSASAPPAPPAERRLELAPPTETVRPAEPVPEPVAAPAAAAPEAVPAAGMLDALQELRGELAETRRLMEVKDAEIAALQARLAELESAPLDTAPAAGAETAVVAEPATAEPAPPPVVPAPAPSATDRFFGALGSLWLWLVIAVVLVLAAIAVFLRKRKEEERSIEEELAQTGTWGAIEPTGQELGTGAAAAAAVKVTPRRSRGEDDSFRVEETQRQSFAEPAAPRDVAVPSPAAGPLPEPASQKTGGAEEEYQYPFEDTIAGETGIDLDQSDPLAEADFHMAYGLYDQAAEIIKKAIEREPGRYDLRRKLIDICFVWGNAEEFLAQAGSVREEGGEAAEADWAKIAIMGRQICPGEPLFETADAAAVDVDLGADAEELPQPGQDTGASGAWLDFDVGESDGSDEVSYESIGDTQEQRALDVPDARVERTAEINLEELGIDLELGESGEYALQDLADIEPEAGEEEDGGTMMMEGPSLFRGTNDPTQRGEGFEVSEDEPTISGESGLEQEPAGDELAVTGLEDEEADQTLVKKFELPPEEAPTTEVDTFETEDEDLDLDDLTQVLEAELVRGRSEDEQATQLADGFELESTDEEDELPEEELGDTQEMPPVEMDEVGTKLDLARAYIDMGDPDGARSILEEVASEGDEKQQEEARELLDSLD